MCAKGVCKICRRKKEWISTRGYCKECGWNKRLAAAKQLHAHKGYYWKKWKASMKRYLKSI